MHLPEPLDLLPTLLSGLVVTLKLAGGGALLAACTALTAGLLRLSRWRPIRATALVFIDLFRGTSALVQLFWVYFALPILGIRLDAMTAGILVLGLNHGAYGAEVVRGAILAIPKEQLEASVALNFTPRQALLRIVFPQALLLMLPPFGNLLIELLKNTALASMITLSDLTFQAQVLRTATLRSGEIFTLVLILYFLLALMITAVMRSLERKMAVGRETGEAH